MKTAPETVNSNKRTTGLFRDTFLTKWVNEEDPSKIKENSSSSNVIIRSKPKFRGMFHKIAFYFYLVVAIYYVIRFKRYLEIKPEERQNMMPKFVAFGVYMFTLLWLYACSSIYHRYNFKTEETKQIFHKLDHCNIFVLIAGTYTANCLICMPWNEQPWVFHLFIAAWTTAIIGVIKTMLWWNAPVIIKLAFYFVTGLVILPFLPTVIRTVDLSTSTLFELAGVSYLAGGMFYGLQKPNISPDFGYHEIFHLLTIVGNLCFFVPNALKLRSLMK